MRRVLLLGAYGNFGRRIALGLAKRRIPLILLGRDTSRLNALKTELQNQCDISVDTCVASDVNVDFKDAISKTQAFLVINTCGPFQEANYSIPEVCIARGSHYIDLSDGRRFVCDIKGLHASAIQNNVTVITGASTVPALSSAVLEEYRHSFSKITSLRYGISPGQKTQRGLATTRAVLSYVGRPMLINKAEQKTVYGWQNLYRQIYPELGKRWMGNCDIPDLELFPEKYGIENISFAAGLESNVLHLSLWLLSGLIRCSIPLKLQQHAKYLLNMSRWFDRFGSDAGGMHIIIAGITPAGEESQLEWFLIAKDGDGPEIPTIPAILLAEKIYHDKLNYAGAFPCIGLLNLPEYLRALEPFNISTYLQRSSLTSQAN